MTDAPTISTHILDVENGRPAAGTTVYLYRFDGETRKVGEGTTDSDGRIPRLLDGPLDAGDYELRFAIRGPFWLRLACGFRVEDVSRSYHIPLLLSSYSLSTYRGS